MSIRPSPDWWATFFSGLAVSTISRIFGPEVTRREADFVERVLELRPGARVLDVPCGSGRITLELAARGHRAAGIDLVPALIAEARAATRERGLTAEFTAGDMQELAAVAEFDAACCLGNSFSYFDDRGNERFLAGVARALKPGGRFLLDASTVAELILPSPLNNSWHVLGDTLILRNAAYDHERGRFDVEYTFLRGAEVEKKAASYRVYTYREVAALLAAAGFADVRGLSSYESEPFAFGARALFLTAVKR
jgi:SAM-dependent methyltransferase